MIHARICPRRATCMHMRKCMVLSCTCIRVQGSCNHAVTQHRQSPWPADEQPGLAVSRRDHDDAAEARRTPRTITFPPSVFTAFPTGCFFSVPAYMLREALSLTPAVPGPLLGFGSLLQPQILAPACRRARGPGRALRIQQRAARGNADGVPETAEGSPWRARTHWWSARCAQGGCADGTRTRPGKSCFWSCSGRRFSTSSSSGTVS